MRLLGKYARCVWTTLLLVSCKFLARIIHSGFHFNGTDARAMLQLIERFRIRFQTDFFCWSIVMELEKFICSFYNRLSLRTRKKRREQCLFLFTFPLFFTIDAKLTRALFYSFFHAFFSSSLWSTCITRLMHVKLEVFTHFLHPIDWKFREFTEPSNPTMFSSNISQITN